MKRIFAAMTALLLMLALFGPATVAAQGGWIGDVTITSATVDRSGMVQLQGTVWCSEGMNLNLNGQIMQVIGRKTTLQSGLGGGLWCIGTTMWWSGTTAGNGSFSPGWATIDVGFEALSCDPNNPSNCWPYAQGGGHFYLKIARK